MIISDILSVSDEDKLRAKMNKEYSAADSYTKSWKEDVKWVREKYLLPKNNEDRVKIRKVLNNLKVRKSIFLSDEIQVTNVSMNWVLGQETAQNTDNVFQANFKSMNIRQKYEEALDDDAMYWVWVLTVSGWNNHSQEPILEHIDATLTFPDPKNWRGNNMRYFGTLLRKNLYELESDDAYDNERVTNVQLKMNADIEDLDTSNAAIKWFNASERVTSEDLIDIYNHITIFQSSEDDKPSQYLTTWGADRTILIRAVKMRALTENELADPSKISLWVELFRWNPIVWSYAWVSLIDDVWQYQDIETLLTNLQIEQAKLAAMWGKTYVDDRLGIDIDDLANNSWPWDVVPFASTDPNITAANGIREEQTRPVNPITANTIATVNQLAQEATNMSAIVQWQSLSGQQTKSEIQTLQQNINQVISLMASNYMEGLKGMWEDIYRSYAANMSSQRIKQIVIVDWDNVYAYGYKKKEFISEWEFYIIVKSKAQEELKKKKDFAVLLSVFWLLKQSVKPWSTQDVILDRTLIENSGVKSLDAKSIHPHTRDERIAYGNLGLLNRDIEVSAPEVWEDHNVYINIYKTWLDTPANNRAIKEREVMLTAIPEQPQAPEEPKGNSTAWLWASLIAQDNAQQGDWASLADISV